MTCKPDPLHENNEDAIRLRRLSRSSLERELTETCLWLLDLVLKTQNSYGIFLISEKKVRSIRRLTREAEERLNHDDNH